MILLVTWTLWAVCAMQLGTPRTRIVYKQVSKTGSSSLKVAFEKVLGKNVTVVRDGPPVPKELWSRRKQYFWIGSVRNPCEWQMSWWGYEIRRQLFDCAKEQNLNMTRPEEVIQAYSNLKELCPWIEDREEAFWIWLQFNYGHQSFFFTTGFHVEGLLTPEKLLGLADCFIRTESLYDDFVYCLRMFENQGGYVDWSLVVPDVVPRNHNESPHPPCESQLGSKKQGQDVLMADEAITKAFNYTCCGRSRLVYEMEEKKVISEHETHGVSTLNKIVSLVPATLAPKSEMYT